MSSSVQLIRCGYSSTMSTVIGISPNAKFQTAAKLEATGSTSFGNCTCRIRPPAPVTEVIPS